MRIQIVCSACAKVTATVRPDLLFLLKKNEDVLILFKNHYPCRFEQQKTQQLRQHTFYAAHGELHRLQTLE